MNPLYIAVPVLLIIAFEMILAFYGSKEKKKQYPQAKKPKKTEIRRYVYMDEFEKSIS